MALVASISCAPVIPGIAKSVISIARQLLLQQTKIAEDGCEQIVEVMSDTPRELADLRRLVRLQPARY